MGDAFPGVERVTDFLLELRSEEIPARMQKSARAELERLFRREMDGAGVECGAVIVWSTPRRLALIARDIPLETQAVSEEFKGPPEAAPDKAVDGFCRKNGLTRNQLEVRDVKGRPTYFATIDTPGRAMKDVLGEAIPAMIRDFAWPKSMRWGGASLGTESLRWVRPLSGIVALLGTEIVECEVHGVTSGAVTLGHRFHHSGDITIGGADDYAVKLRAAHVVVDHDARETLVRDGARRVFDDAGLEVIADEDLVVENAGLTEWPVVLMGGFDEAYLELPPEVIRLTAKLNQKYFMGQRADRTLAPMFACVANIEAADDGAAIVAGNERVLDARLSDARFFWDVDRKQTLSEHAEGLQRITFHEKLGTVADKVERVAKLARWLVDEGVVEGVDADEVEMAARLCKADLVTEMVGEFPELQGLMGGYYAHAEGLPVAIADAIRDHYRPMGQKDDVPTAPVTVAVSLADKLDTLAGFYIIGEQPTGSKDPFALRRAALGVIRLILVNGLRLRLGNPLSDHMLDIPSFAAVPHASAVNDLKRFIADRLMVQQRDKGVRHDLADAVFNLQGNDDLVIAVARVQALQSFIEGSDGANLLAGYKRAGNILKKEGMSRDAIDSRTNDLSYTPEPAEKALIDALDTAEPQARQATEREDFAAAMSALASLRAPIDRFFEEVTVNDDDVDKRSARLALLARFKTAVHGVADFSRIEG
ncbi:MAG: glycine--tRNA ligase subunit beta [Pontixanthobacter sp.]